MNELLEYMYSLPRDERKVVAKKLLKLVGVINSPVDDDATKVESKKIPKPKVESDRVSKPSIKRTKKTTKLDTPQNLNPKDEKIFEKLKKWRNQVARDLEIPSYLIFSNDTLKSMAHYKPKTDDDFLKIKGMGDEKCGKYSESISEILGNVDDLPKRMLPPNK